MDADDVTQEVFIRVWENFEKFNINKARAWIMRTTHNLCLDYLRRRKTAMQRELQIDDGFEDDYNFKDEKSDPSIQADMNMRQPKIKEAIDNLPEILRSVFVLYELNGLKYKEIGNVLDIPINSVKVYLMRARKKLQEELREYEYSAKKD
jgi:RNA polymerase sigma-70 factor (ECF subfamily)